MYRPKQQAISKGTQAYTVNCQLVAGSPHLVHQGEITSFYHHQLQYGCSTYNSVKWKLKNLPLEQVRQELEMALGNHKQFQAQDKHPQQATLLEPQSVQSEAAHVPMRVKESSRLIQAMTMCKQILVCLSTRFQSYDDN